MLWMIDWCGTSRQYDAVADLGFSRGVHQFPNRDYFANFLPKLHENERIWTPRGLASLAPPLDPPMQRSSESGEWKWFGMNGKLLFRKRCLYYGNGLKGDLVVNVVNTIENDINNIINDINDNNNWNLTRIPRIMKLECCSFCCERQRTVLR